MFKVEKLKPSTPCKALTFISETVIPLSRPLFSKSLDLRKVLKEKFKFFQDF